MEKDHYNPSNFKALMDVFNISYYPLFILINNYLFYFISVLSNYIFDILLICVSI